MSFNVKTAFEKWSAVNHPLLNFAALTHHPDITLDIPRKPLAMPIEMPLMAASTSTLVAVPAILPIQTIQTVQVAELRLPTISPASPAAANHYAM
jgi:hypothetical protein